MSSQDLCPCEEKWSHLTKAVTFFSSILTWAVCWLLAPSTKRETHVFIFSSVQLAVYSWAQHCFNVMHFWPSNLPNLKSSKISRRNWQEECRMQDRIKAIMMSASFISQISHPQWYPVTLLYFVGYYLMSNNTELAHRDKRHSKVVTEIRQELKERNEGEEDWQKKRGKGRCPQCWRHSAVDLINYIVKLKTRHIWAHTHTHTLHFANSELWCWLATTLMLLCNYTLVS